MAKLAIDVALLPPDEILDICVGINKAINAQPFLELSKQDRRPHISLAMGVIEEKDIPIISKKIERIAHETPGIDLTITEICHEVMPNQKDSKLMALEQAEGLKNLHVKIMEAIWPHASYQVDVDMFYSDPGEPVDPVSTYWASNYGKKYNHPDKYQPSYYPGMRPSRI